MSGARVIKDKNTIKDLLDVYPVNSKKRLLIEYALRSGLRVSDIITTKVKDVYNQDTYKVTEKKTGKTKELALHDALKLSIVNYVNENGLTPDDFLFYSNMNKQSHIQRVQAHKIVAKAGDMIGLKLSCHDLRRSFGYAAYSQGVPVELLQIIFQHSSQAVTLRYIGVTQENINNVYKKIDLGF